ncbi:MAG: ubiquinol oxidase subunit [Bradyrhizobium sp.]|nr:ubiquinol oxidase subunit [Bradyrhizobium sp.]
MLPYAREDGMKKLGSATPPVKRVKCWLRKALRLRTHCAFPLLLAGCEPGVLDPRGPIARADRTILLDSLAIMLAIVIPTILGTIAVAWWYRAGNGKAHYRPTWAFSGRIELVVWSIPCMVVLLLSGVAWIGSHQLDPMRPLPAAAPALEVQVVSMDWKWLFIYPKQGVASVNELVVPTGVPLHFSLTSASVMNAFFVPQLGSMIYTMNGMATQLNLQADTPGTYRGLSSHYSGERFSDMHFAVRALLPSEFEAWAQWTARSGPTLDESTYIVLTRQSTQASPSIYSNVSPDLFGRVVRLELKPAPGPAAMNGGAKQLPVESSQKTDGK